MKLTRLLLALRAGALIAAAGFVAANLRGYLIGRWNLSVSPGLDGVLGLAFIWIVSWLSTRRLLRELRADTKRDQPQILVPQFKVSECQTETVHRYPLRLGYVVTALGIFLVALPYFSVEPGKGIALVTYVACFGIACIVFAIDFYIFTYSVTIKHDGILVKAFGKRNIAFSDVINTEVVKTKNGPQIVLTLKNGQVLRFGGMLTDFSTMLSALTAPTPHNDRPTDRW